jgi:GxxExxY protein
MTRDELNSLTQKAMDCAFTVHSALGPGLLESSYTACLRYELEKRGFGIRVEVPVPVVYDGQQLVDVGYRMDLLVGGEVVVEVKALEVIAPVHLAQLLSYLKHSKRRVGLLLNFNVTHMKDGIHRRVNHF